MRIRFEPCIAAFLSVAALEAYAAEPQPSAPVATGASVTPPEALKLRFAFAGGLGFGNAELGERAALTPVPDSSLYGSKPVSGSYRSVSLMSLRTVESILIPRSPTRDLVIGAGLDIQTRMSGEHSYESEKGVPIDLEAYALTVEVGARKRLWGLQNLEILGGLDWVLLGKTALAYRAKDETLVMKEYVQEDKLGMASFRLSLRGRYMIQFLDFMSTGIEFDETLGRYSVASRSDGMWTQTSTLRGVLAIDLE